MKLLITFAILLQAAASELYGSSNGVTFQKYYPGTYDRTSREILELSNGDYLITGMTNNSTLNDCDVYVIRTNSNGDELWNKTFGGSKPDYSYGMVETTDGNFMIVGFTQSFGGGDYDVYLLKIDQQGNKIWEKDLGGFTNEEGREIVKTSDGNYVIVGTANMNTAQQDAFLMKVDGSGTVIWTKYYGGTAKEFGNSVQLCPDGGFVLTGQTFSSGNGMGDVYLVRTDSGGNMIWSKTYGGADDDEGVSVVSNGDGSFAIAVRDSSHGNDVDVRVIKTDSTGQVTWESHHWGELKDTPKRIRATKDGGYIIGAISRSFGWMYPDIWLIKLDANGKEMWTRRYGLGDHEHVHDIKESSDSGYIIVGHTRSHGPAQYILFMKVDGQGLVGLGENLLAGTDVKFFPNPVKGYLNIEAGDEKIRSVSVTDLNGKHIAVTELPSLVGEASKKISFAGAQGIYLVAIETRKGVLTRKVIVEKQ